MVRNRKMSKKHQIRRDHRSNLLSVTVRRRCHNGHPVISTPRSTVLCVRWNRCFSLRINSGDTIHTKQQVSCNFMPSNFMSSFFMSCIVMSCYFTSGNFSPAISCPTISCLSFSCPAFSILLLQSCYFSPAISSPAISCPSFSAPPLTLCQSSVNRRTVGASSPSCWEGPNLLLWGWARMAESRCGRMRGFLGGAASPTN